MVHILFPEQVCGRPLPFFLAAEEYLARSGRDDCLFLWQVSPTVIAGRNQDMESEVDMDFCRAEGIDICRRKSGGGCVYADMGNLMVSAVVGGNDRMFLFSRFISLFALCLRNCGFGAWPSGRNDITVDGRKVSGSACYGIGCMNIIHATLLCDADISRMQKAITPPVEKLRPKGITSVRQRVANLSEFARVDMQSLQTAIVRTFCDGERTLTSADMAAIGHLMASYLDPAFISGRHSRKQDTAAI